MHLEIYVFWFVDDGFFINIYILLCLLNLVLKGRQYQYFLALCAIVHRGNIEETYDDDDADDADNDGDIDDADADDDDDDDDDYQLTVLWQSLQ